MRRVDEAQAQLLALCAPRASESLLIEAAAGRVLADNVVALRTHPPFAASAMDGYAVHGRDVQALPADLEIIGDSVAGARFHGGVAPGCAVRILTGAPMPRDVDCVIVQEDVVRDGNRITIVGKPTRLDQHIRRAGLDAQAGSVIAGRGEKLSPARQGFLAAAGVTRVAVHRPVEVEILACGDELKLPGAALGDDDIIASNGLILAAMLAGAGAQVTGADRIIPDELDALTRAVRASTADMIVTIGGASVGDRDFVQAALAAAGVRLEFWKVALKPGKPMMVGQRGAQVIIGLPGNPVSAFVCAQLFVLPALRAMQGEPMPLPQALSGVAGAAIRPGGDRAEYLRSVARLDGGIWQVTPHAVQDSSMLSVLAASNALLIRPPGAPAVEVGQGVEFLFMNA